MQKYESTVIFSPEIAAEKVEELIEKIKKTVEQSNGKVTLAENMGKKRFSYDVKKFKEGTYFYMEFTGEGDVVKPLEGFYKVTDSILRYLTVKQIVKKKPKKAEKPRTQPDDKTAAAAPASASAPAKEEAAPASEVVSE